MSAENEWIVTSPDGAVALAVRLGAPHKDSSGATCLSYQVDIGGERLLQPSPLGIVRRDQAFAGELSFESASPVTGSDTTYMLPHGKRRIYRDAYNERTIVFKNGAGARVELILRAYGDGIAFRYRFPEERTEPHVVGRELTGFQLPAGAKIWAHPYDEATEYTPAYETYYEEGIPAGSPSPTKAGWAYPLLFKAGDDGPWGLVSEAAVDRTYAGSRLEREAPGGLYRLRFPDPGEGNATGAVEPSWTLPWATPWRAVIAARKISGIVESTLITNLNPPSIVKDAGWIKPGRASWSWLYDHDSPQDFVKLRDYVDLAAEMSWEYSLVDANWTIMKHGTLHELARYAQSKGVGLLLWYNSGGPHNYVSEKPRGLMDHRSIRRKELQFLKDWGIKGIKVDFFQSDKQNVIALYQDILEDAAEFQIMVNFHGCTLPRGWSRTYPHLLSMEAVRGEECYSFDPRFPAKAPGHNTTLPFTRNVVGPMDYTPVMFKNNVYPLVTTAAHELALPVIFESGLVHFADGADVYRALPPDPQDFLRRVPVAWDETRLLLGEPSEYVVMARRRGQEWFVAGINGKGKERTVVLDMAFLGKGRFSGMLLEDGPDGRSLASEKKPVEADTVIQVRMRPHGGFVLDLAPAP
jgi:alpha-glucosidase